MTTAPNLVLNRFWFEGRNNNLFSKVALLLAAVRDHPIHFRKCPFKDFREKRYNVGVGEALVWSWTS